MSTRRQEWETALSEASERGCRSIAEVLLAAGANTNSQDRHGRTPLLIAVRYDNNPVTDALLAAGAEIEIKARNGITALMEAASLGRVTSVKKLLESGADIAVVDKKFQDAKYHAKKNKQDAVVSFLDMWLLGYRKDEGIEDEIDNDPATSETSSKHSSNDGDCCVELLNSERNNYVRKQFGTCKKLLWNRLISKPYPGFIEPLYAFGHTIYACTCNPPKNLIADMELTAIDLDSGKLLVQRKMQNIHNYRASFISKGVFFLSDRNGFTPLRPDLTSSVLMEVGRSDSSLLLSDEVIYETKNGVHFLNPHSRRSRQTIWRRKVEKIAASNGILVTSSNDYKLAGYRVDDGELLWEQDLANQSISRGTDSISRSWSTAGPVIYEEKIYLRLLAKLMCFSLIDGRPLWENSHEQFQRISRIVLGHDKLFGYDGFTLTCLDAHTGEIVFTRELFDSLRSGTQNLPILMGDSIIIGDEGINAFSLVNGDLLWSFLPKKAKKERFRAQAVYINDRLLAMGSDGVLYCFG